MRAILYHRVSDGHREGRRPERPESGLSLLRRHAEGRGWQVTEEILDHQARPGEARPGFERLLELAKAESEVVAATGLSRLFVDVASAAHHLGAWLARTPAPLHFVTIGDGLDSTQALDLRSWVELLRALRESARALPRERAVAAAFHRVAGAAGGGETTAWDVVRIRQLYAEGLSQRAMAEALSTPETKVAQSSLNRRIRILRDRGELDDDARSRSLANRPHSKGGRPRTKQVTEKPDPRGRQRS
ncbi:MAG: recombinase family protein [Acidobacteriota bacterium]